MLDFSKNRVFELSKNPIVLQYLNIFENFFFIRCVMIKNILAEWDLTNNLAFCNINIIIYLK